MTGSQAGISKAAILLSGCADAAQIAQATGRQPSTVSHYLAGRTVPPEPVKRIIAERWPSVAIELWHVSAGIPEPGPGLPPAESLAEMPPTGQAVNDLARRLTAEARRTMSAIEAAATHTEPLMHAKQIDQLAATVVRLGKFTGLEITERQILDSPRWRAIERTIIRALEPYPDAMRDVAAALKGLGNDD